MAAMVIPVAMSMTKRAGIPRFILANVKNEPRHERRWQTERTQQRRCSLVIGSTPSSFQEMHYGKDVREQSETPNDDTPRRHPTTAKLVSGFLDLLSGAHTDNNRSNRSQTRHGQQRQRDAQTEAFAQRDLSFDL